VIEFVEQGKESIEDLRTLGLLYSMEMQLSDAQTEAMLSGTGMTFICFKHVSRIFQNYQQIKESRTLRLGKTAHRETPHLLPVQPAL
jgi:hypothetical protein